MICRVSLGRAYVLLVEFNPFSELVNIFPNFALRTYLGIGRLCHIGLGFLKVSLYCTTQTERLKRKLCYFIISNYIQLSLLIRSIVLSLHT